MKSVSIQKICSAVIVCALFLFLFHLRYDMPLIGDDVSGLVANNPDSTYIDGATAQGECVLNMDYSLGAIWSRVVSNYFSWGGRIVSKFAMIPMLMLLGLPDGINWVLFSAYIALLQMCMFGLTVWTICRGKGGGRSFMPALLFLAAVLLFYNPSYSYAYMTRIMMYTFSNIYVLSVILYLLLYLCIGRCMERKNEPGGV